MIGFGSDGVQVMTGDGKSERKAQGEKCSYGPYPLYGTGLLCVPVKQQMTYHA